MSYRLFSKVFFVLCAVVLVTSTPLFAATQNTMTITDKSGSGLTNYPLSFGRPFIQGEITNFPEVLLNGIALPTQADVKNRYSDGSVKYAIISVILPKVPSGGSVSLTFRNIITGNNAPLSKEQLLDSKFNFDATLTVASGTSQKVSARTMLINGDYTLWTSGPIAQTILLADDTAARKYDLGFDTYKSLRPRFYATFWPSLNKVTVRIVGENSNTATLQDIAYSLSVSTGYVNPQTVYTKGTMIHPYLTRWTKMYWIGGEPEERVNIDNNLPYLIDTNYFPNYDTSVVVPEQIIADSYSKWTTSKHDIFENGFWTKYMPTTGGRDDIGFMTTWATRWLYSGDWRTRAVALGQANLASSWPLHAREGNTTKKIDKAQTSSGLGLPISVYAYPTTWLPDNNGSYGIALKTPRMVTNPSEFPPHGYAWIPDGAHQPDPFYAQYVLTGDYYYLEESQMWASMSALSYCVGASWCRGPSSPAMAGIEDQVRGDAWVFRNRANAAIITPDTTPVLKNFYLQMTNDALAIWEGQMNITGTSFQNTPEWKWGSTNANSATNPLHVIGCQTGGSGCQIAQWMHYYFMSVMGIEKERGIQTGALSTWLNYMLTSQIVAKNYNVYNLGSYWINVRDSTTAGNWIPTWADLQQENISKKIMVAAGTFTVTSPGSYYPILAMAASSFMTKEPNGQTTWDFLKTNVKDAALVGNSSVVPTWYKGFFDGTGEIGWNFLPRGTSPSAPIIPITPTNTPIQPSTPAPTNTKTTTITTTVPTTPVTPQTPTPTAPLITNGALLWPAAPNVLIATTSNATLTATDGITKVEGLSGNNTVYLTKPGKDANKSWYRVTYNADKSVSITDIHGSGFTVIVYNIQKVVFPSNEGLFLDGDASNLAAKVVTVTPVPTPTPAPTPTPTTPAPTTTTVVTSTTPSLLWPAAPNVLIATTSNATLTATDGITKVEGLSGNNTVYLTKPGKDANKSWYRVTYNADKSVTITDVHATGYSVQLYNIQNVVFPSKETMILSGPSASTLKNTVTTALKDSIASTNHAIKTAEETIPKVIFSTMTASAESCVTITKNLHRGYETQEVSSLQKFLISKGLLTKETTGFFGDFTREAVLRYQKNLNLPETGMVYEMTRKAITSETCKQE